MANKDDYLTYYREFFESFAQTVNPNDQLPVKLASYRLVNLEVVGGIIDWTTQYLTQKKCPQCLQSTLIQYVIEEIRKAVRKQPVSYGFIPSDDAYEPLKLMQAVMAKTNEICLRYLDNSMLCSLPPPGLPQNIVSVCALRNKRKQMEDRHVVIHDLNTIFNIQEGSPSSYYAIFDGHAGQDAAAYSAAHLHQFLVESKHYVDEPLQALLDAFVKTDQLFVDKCKVERFSSGTTAVCALLRPKEKSLYIAWVGDSQALLVNQGRILQCVDPHKPCRTDEKERIEKEGGYVCYWGTWRVNGQLAVSRAIGDLDYKPYVTAVPDIREVPLDGAEDFLILACDGLWDYLSEEDAARAVYKLLAQTPDKTDHIAGRLAALSKQRGSTDNISVIVLFLRDPSKIAAEAHWANRNGSPLTMDTSLDNANNPFTNSNGSADSNILAQKGEGLLLNLSDSFKRNGSDLSPDFFHAPEKANGKRSVSDFQDGDLGPESNVDAVDEAVFTEKPLPDAISNNNPIGAFNPFMEKTEVEKEVLDLDLDLLKQQSIEFDGQRSPREETPTPPADAVHDGGIDEHNIVADSGEESEDEWNYIKGEEANKENISPSQPDREVADLLEEEDDDDEDNMSQLNPNAAEFVPVSPTRSIPSPVCRSLITDPVISQSPKRPKQIHNPPSDLHDFEKELESRPNELDAVLDLSNGHSDDVDHEEPPMEQILNGKNIDEIPVFEPNTATKSAGDEFHFGPNAAPFTPIKLLDQSEAALSTRAVFGDDSTNNIDDFNVEEDEGLVIDSVVKSKEDDPMSMSFYKDQFNNEDPFDPNKVQILPDNLDDFLSKTDTSNDLIIADVPQENLLDNSVPEPTVQTTDLDKLANDDVNELTAPGPQLVEIDEIQHQTVTCHLSSDLLQDEPQPIIEFREEPLPDLCLLPKSPEHKVEETPLTPEPKIEETPATPEPKVEETLLIPEPTVEEVPATSEPTVEEVPATPEPQPAEEKPATPEVQPMEEIPATPEQEVIDEITQFPEPQAIEEKLLTFETEPLLIKETQTEESSPLAEDLGTIPVCIDALIQTEFKVLTPEVEEAQSPTNTEEIIPETISFETKSIESLVEDVTSSVKDISSPTQVFVSDHDETLFLAFSSPQSVATVDVNSFLDRTQLSEISPLVSPNKVEEPILEKTVVPEISLTTAKEAPKEVSAAIKKPAGAKSPLKKPAAAKAPTATKSPTATKATTATKAPAPSPSARVASRGAFFKVRPRPNPEGSTGPALPPKPRTSAPAPRLRTAFSVTSPTTRTTVAGKTGVATGAVPKKPLAPGRPTAPKPKLVLTSLATTNGVAAPRPRPATARPTSTTTLGAKKLPTTDATKTTVTKTSTALPKTRPVTAPGSSRPRVPLTKTVSKTATTDDVKQNKDSANKLTASRSATTTKSSTVASARASATSTVRKTETKTMGSSSTRTTVTKTTTISGRSTSGATASKKPQELVRGPIKQPTKPTAINNPQENGVTSTVVSEQITVANNAVNESESQLVKDNSPIDNKLIVNTNAAD